MSRTERGDRTLRTAGDHRERALRIALLVYRGNPHCGGQGVYVRHLSRQLVSLGHAVSVFSGQPYPELDAGVELVRVPSLDLYRAEDPFRIPRLRELGSASDVLELATMMTGGFGEPRTFGLRVRQDLMARAGEFDVIHDDQGLSPSLLDLARNHCPVIASIHHPITIDRDLDLEESESFARSLSLRRWYGFARRQAFVARKLDRIITPSESARDDIVEQMGVPARRIAVVHAGVDAELFRPRPRVAPVPFRIITTASADVALKGLIYLLEAVAKLRVEHEQVHLVVVGKLRMNSPTSEAIDRLDLNGVVRFCSDISDDKLVELYASSSVAVVPSLYEGFSLPAVEAMACGIPLVATTSGALPEVTGVDGETVLAVAPRDPSALATAIERLLSDADLARRLGRSGRERVVGRFTWREAAKATVEQYLDLLDRFRSC